MMDQRPLRGLLGLLGAGLAITALAGCGSVVASASPAAPAAATTAAKTIGCASANQATSVSIRRVEHLKVPTGSNPLATITYRKTAAVRALFGQLCAAVTHPAPAEMLHCPADFGTEYVGTFFDGSRELATFSYASTGCARASVTAAGKTQATMVFGRAAAAAPHLAADLAAVLGNGQQPGMMPPQGGINPGGPNMPA